MHRRNLYASLAALAAGVALSGCMPKMTLEEMKAEMPERPVELNRLDAFVGNWHLECESNCTGMDETMRSTGTEETAWEGDNWYLVRRSVFTMDDMDPMHGMEIWTYDTHAKIYRITWTFAMGSVGTGTGKYNESTKTWTMKATSYSPWGTTTGTGTAKFIDQDTVEWKWTDYMMGGLIKTMEMTGTSRRR